MDVTAIEQALVDLEPVALEADDGQVRDAAARAMAALVAFVGAISPGREIEVDEEEIPADSTLAALRGMALESGEPLDTQTPHSSLSRARRRPKPNMM